MSYHFLPATQAFWRPSNQMRVLNCDLAKQLEAATLGARLWRLTPGQASTRHRHRSTTELYLVLEGTGRLRVAGALLTLAPLDSVLVQPGTVRQLFNDTAADQLWLVVGAPPEPASTLAMSPEELAWVYPDGPKALPAELRTVDGRSVVLEDRQIEVAQALGVGEDVDSDNPSAPNR